MERPALLVVPGFLGLVLVVDENGLAIPVVVLPRQIAATLEQQDLLAGRGQLVCERAAARTRAYDDDVVARIRHETSLQSIPTAEHLRRRLPMGCSRNECSGCDCRGTTWRSALAPHRTASGAARRPRACRGVARAGRPRTRSRSVMVSPRRASAPD